MFGENPKDMQLFSFELEQNPNQSFRKQVPVFQDYFENE